MPSIWQSQNKVSDTSPTAYRYINHEKLGHEVLLFVREYKLKDGHASPFIFMGKANHVSNSGSKTVSFELNLIFEKLPTWILILTTLLLEGSGLIIGALIIISFLKKQSRLS